MTTEQTSTESLVDELRQELRKALETYVGGDKISPQEAEPFLHVSYKTVYAWLSDKSMYMPRPEDAKAIIEFVALVEKLTDRWREVLAEYRPDVENGQLRLYDEDMLRVLEGNQTTKSKLVLLVKLSLRKLAKERSAKTG
jgi:hypothetical protein